MESNSLRVLIVTRIACAIGLVQSLLWITLSIVSMISYYNCAFINPAMDLTDLFGVAIHRFYFLGPSCLEQETLDDPEILTSSEVNTWAIISLVLNCAWFISSFVLCFYACGVLVKNIFILAYVWVFFGTAVLIVDVTLGTLFALTYSKIGDIIADSFEPFMAMQLLILRSGTLFLMFFAFKGFVLLLVNFSVIMSTLAIMCDEFTVARMTDSDTRREPINAFESNHRRSFSQSISERASGRRSQNGRYSWHPSSTNNSDRNMQSDWLPVSTTNSLMAPTPMPFSYIDNNPMWALPKAENREPSTGALYRRTQDRVDMTPSVPEPDYSPLGHRRLKSALKTTA